MPGRRPGKLDINDADEREMEGAGLTDEMAKRILDYRNRHGRFESLDQIANVAPLEPSDLESLRNIFTCKPARAWTDTAEPRSGKTSTER